MMLDNASLLCMCSLFNSFVGVQRIDDHLELILKPTGQQVTTKHGRAQHHSAGFYGSATTL
jgi:hypothetical protein